VTSTATASGVVSRPEFCTRLANLPLVHPPHFKNSGSKWGSYQVTRDAATPSLLDRRSRTETSLDSLRVRLNWRVRGKRWLHFLYRVIRSETSRALYPIHLYLLDTCIRGESMVEFHPRAPRQRSLREAQVVRKRVDPGGPPETDLNDLLLSLNSIGPSPE
jgi:hypothetical protein